jgi:hypothetical protein
MSDSKDVRDDAAPRDSSDHLTRTFVADGALWTVRLRIGTYDRRRPDLVFECEQIIRRVRDYPEDWHALSDEQLFALSSRL